MDIKTLLDKIEENIGNAYEVGHAHGGNAFRMMQGSKSERVDEGWGQYFEAIKKDITDYITGATEAQDGWKRVEDELPKIGETVLVSDGVRVKEAFYCKRTDKDEPHFLFTTMKNITHWRKLPSPPSNDKP